MQGEPLQVRHQVSQQLSRISVSVKRNWSDGLLVTPGLHGLWHSIQRDHANGLFRIQAPRRQGSRGQWDPTVLQQLDLRVFRNLRHHQLQKRAGNASQLQPLNGAQHKIVEIQKRQIGQEMAFPIRFSRGIDRSHPQPTTQLIR